MLRSWKAALASALLFVPVACGGATKGKEGEDSGVECSPPRALCSNACVDVAGDPLNCGGCGVTCDAGAACVHAACVAALTSDAAGDAGASAAADATADAAADGARQLDAGSDASALSDGAIDAPPSDDAAADAAPLCPSPETAFDAGCEDLTSDPDNCGACGHTCGSNKTCSAGLCSPICTGGQADCLGACVSILTDPTNCGVCGRSCGLYGGCSDGGCVLACPAGLSACGETCVSLATSQLHCGACPNACPSGQLCADGGCYTPPASIWQTVGSDGQHTGNNPNETGRPPLAPLWSNAVGSGGLWPVVYEDGILFAMQGGTLYALNPETGAQLWVRALGTTSGVAHVGMPTASGNVYAAMSGNAGNTFLYVVNEATGALLQTFPFASQWETYWAPLVVGDKVYFEGGEYGGMYGYDVTTASQIFFTALDQYDSWSPAWFNDTLYSFMDGNFRAMDPSTGDVAWTVNVPYTWDGYSMNTATVFGPEYGYFISPPTLYAIDPVAHTTAWSEGASYTATPAYANGLVFAIGGGNLRVLDATTGALRWTFAGDGTLSYPAAIANGFVYVASDANTYAVNLDTEQPVWTAPVGGWLTIAGGDLFIAGSGGTLSAYNLSQ